VNARSFACAVVLAVSVGAAPPAAAENSPTVLARFTTSYAFDADHKARASNVELAAEAINGKVIAAGGTFSFNDAVGERTAAFGYAKSIVLRDGMIAEGMGGGACQVASTLHAAALLGGLEVVSRAPHTRPSAYIRMGLDATVAMGSPSIDLKLKNSTAAPVVIHSRAGRGSLEVWVDTTGAVRPDVSLSSEITERTAFSRVVERDKAAKENTIRVKAFGIPGFRIKRTRELRAADGTVKRDLRIDVYPPTPEVVAVAPTFDESRITLRPAAAESEETPPTIIDTGVPRPALVQLRPSTVVTLDNAAR
jgi:vancomycin resistance protein YoaR